MSKEHRFVTSNKFGKSGEEDVLNYIKDTYPKLKSIRDVSNDREYQLMDVDAILTFEDGTEKMIEIKTDSHDDTGFIAFEFWSSRDEQTPGCMYTTKCDELFYYFPGSGDLYHILMKPYREWVELNKHQFKTKTIPNVSWGRTYYSEVYLVPRAMLGNSFKHVSKYNVKEL